jgi:catechol 2,3-dioxygenase-like lactoylglutathione lyase family enzyme
LKRKEGYFEVMNRIAVFFLVLASLATATQAADKPKSPRILGVAHIAYYVSDLTKAREYWENFLGFQEAFALKNADGTDHIAYVKINDRQFIVLIAEPRENWKNYGFMHDAAFETDDAQGMRDHLASIGVKVPAKVTKDAVGDLSFEFLDNSGFTIQVVQYMPGSKTSLTKGKFMPANRISTHVDHVGLLVNDRESAWKFYGDAFGFEKEGKDGSKMVVGGGPDRFELGVEKKTPTIDRFHVKDHICLSVPDVPKVSAMLMAKPEYEKLKSPKNENHQLGSGKNVQELYDLDGNRAELMEPPKGE